MIKRGRGPSSQLERQWRERMARHRSSGLSVRAFCAAESLPESGFYFWKRTLAERDRERCSNGRPRFVPVQVASESSATIEVVLRDGRTVRLRESVDPERLRAVVAALEAGVAAVVGVAACGMSINYNILM